MRLSKQDYDRVDDDYLKSVFYRCLSFAEVIKTLGFQLSGGAYRWLYRKIEELELDDSHMTGKVWNQGERFRPFNTNKRSFESIFCKDPEVPMGTSKMRLKLFSLGIKEKKCEICGITDWNNKELSFQLHHINGDRTDNRLENLQILCPNCHSQTDNYCGKNTTKFKLRKFNESTEVELIPCPYCGRKVHSDSPHIEKCMNKKMERDAEISKRLEYLKLKQEAGLVDRSGRVHPNLLGNEEWKRREDSILNSGVELKYGCIGKLVEKTGLTWRQVKVTLKRMGISFTNRTVNKVNEPNLSQ